VLRYSQREASGKTKLKRSYEDTVATIRSDLKIINSHHKEFTPIVELKMVETSVDTLEPGLREFLQLLPRLDKRRGLADLGGSILKSLFGTATIADLHSLHGNLNELEAREAVISHSLNNQISYVNGLACVTEQTHTRSQICPLSKLSLSSYIIATRS
jgi:hypothetical protein